PGACQAGTRRCGSRPRPMFPPIVSHRAPTLGPSHHALAELSQTGAQMASLLLHRELSWSFLWPHSNESARRRRGARDLPLIVSADKPTEIGDHGDASGSSPLGRARWLVVSGWRHAGAGA
ncbi:MAG TPA: hypothetical protein VIV12_03475, partial [Streptosporangiaceae bacterium]